jgi:hypothetical protein
MSVQVPQDMAFSNLKSFFWNKVWHISDSLQDLTFPLFSTCSSLLFFVVATKDFCRWGCHNQIILWKIPWCLGPLTTKAPGVNGESYGASEEGSLLGLLQAFASMSSFFGGIFLEGDIGSLWYEFGARNVDKIALNVHLFLCFDQAKIIMA